MMRQSMVAAVVLVLLAPFRAAAQWTTVRALGITALNKTASCTLSFLIRAQTHSP